MAVTVRIPSPLRPLAGGRRAVEIQAGTVAEALRVLDAECPGLVQRICDANGDPFSFLNIFVGDEDIDHRQGLETRLTDGDVLFIVPAESGG
ncbi:MAG TPA: MoaD/ThiS family protein [Chloroflexota bacterium]|nr:MoaD/ThiS family protein [Chloroflexota bacterium]